MNRQGVIAALEEMAMLMELADENVFKVRAFKNGAEALEGLTEPIEAAIADGSLKALKGIGVGLFNDIKCLVETDSLPALEALRAATPAGLIELTEVPGISAKRARTFFYDLGITSVGELEYAVQENRLADLKGFGVKIQAKIGQVVQLWKRSRGRKLLSEVLDEAETLVAAVATLPGVAGVSLAGGLRRRMETVDDIDLVVAAPEAGPVLAAIAALPDVETSPKADAVQGDTASDPGLRLSGVLPLHIQVVTQTAFPATLALGTASPAFREALLAHATQQGLRLDDSGLYRGDAPVSVADEAALFAALNLPPIPPELRESPDSLSWQPDTLIAEADLQGVFHVHTTASDGTASLRDMAIAARARGWRYMGISDHSQSAVYAHGLNRERIREQQAEIAKLNAEFDDFTLLSGVEADILADGALDYDDETLASFDFVIGSIHNRFGHDGPQTTAKLVKALSNPYLTILGHLSGRLLLSREPYDFDLDAVLDTAAKHGKIIELNANPHRLDLDWRHLARAREMGIGISINPDAHSIEGLGHVRWGVAMARKGGLTAADVFNTAPLEAVRSRLRRA